MPDIRPTTLLLTIAFVMFTASMAQAETLRVVARLDSEPGTIVDVAASEDDHIFLLCPGEGRVSDYTLAGELYQHIVREGGQERLFLPTACDWSQDGDLLVFDEAAHKVFFVGADGNIFRGIDLAFPSSDGSLLALSRIGDLSVGSSNTIWVTIGDGSILAGFDFQGNHVISLDLAALLPYQNAVYTRPQVLSDGSLYILDYHQGAVIYRRGPNGSFRRIALEQPTGVEAVPAIQDFAVDETGNVLVASYDLDAPLLLLTPGDGGYQSHTVDINLADGGNRFAVRYSGGKFIVWEKDQNKLVLLELVP